METDTILSVLKWISPIIAAIIEYQFHIINRLKKRLAVFRNKETRAKMLLEYETNVDFEKIKDEFKNIFRTEKEFDIKKNTSLSLSFTYDVFSINLIDAKTGNLAIEVERMGCGIGDLNEKINSFLGKINQISKKKSGDKLIFNNFISCELNFLLPYKWNDLNYYIPKNFVVKDYSINLLEENYKSEINIRLNSVTLKTDAIESVSQIINKFI